MFTEARPVPVETLYATSLRLTSVLLFEEGLMSCCSVETGRAPSLPATS